MYQTCGTPGEPGTGSPVLHEQKRKSGSLTASEYKPSPTAGLRLEMQVCFIFFFFTIYPEYYSKRRAKENEKKEKESLKFIINLSLSLFSPNKNIKQIKQTIGVGKI